MLRWLIEGSESQFQKIKEETNYLILENKLKRRSQRKVKNKIKDNNLLLQREWVDYHPEGPNKLDLD